MSLARIIVAIYGGALVLFGLAAFASPSLFGIHGAPLPDLLHLLSGLAVIYLGQKAGPSALFRGCVGAGAFFLAWGLAGFIFGHPGESTLWAMPPDPHLMVVIPGLFESGRTDHLLHLFFGVAFAIGAVVCTAETPFRLGK